MQHSRRRFLQVTALSGGALYASIGLPRWARAAPQAGTADAAVQLGVFVTIHPDNRIVIGARLWDREKVPPLRYFGNRFANFWVAWAAGFPVADSQSGFRLYPAALLRKVNVNPAARFAFESEILIEAGIAALGLDPRDARRGIDPHGFHRTQVDHHPAVADRAAGDVVPAAAHRGHDALRACEVDRSANVGRAGAAHDQRRASIDHRIPYAARGVVSLFTRKKDSPAHARLESFDCLRR